MVAVDRVREIANLISSDKMAEASAEGFVKRLDEAIIATMKSERKIKQAKAVALSGLILYHLLSKLYLQQLRSEHTA
jgi:hypothetical protein